MPYSFSLSTILNHFKVSLNFETDFVTTKQQQMMIDQFEAEKCLHAASTDNLRLIITDYSPDPRAKPGQFRWYKSRDPV